MNEIKFIPVKSLDRPRTCVRCERHLKIGSECWSGDGGFKVCRDCMVKMIAEKEMNVDDTRYFNFGIEEA